MSDQYTIDHLKKQLVDALEKIESLSQINQSLRVQLDDQAEVLKSPLPIGHNLQVYGDVHALCRVRDYMQIAENNQSDDVQQSLMHDLKLAEEKLVLCADALEFYETHVYNYFSKNDTAGAISKDLLKGDCGARASYTLYNITKR